VTGSYMTIDSSNNKFRRFLILEEDRIQNGRYHHVEGEAFCDRKHCARFLPINDIFLFTFHEHRLLELDVESFGVGGNGDAPAAFGLG
jgi:hypothetical protein